MRFKLLLAALATSAITLTQAQVPTFSPVWSVGAGTNTPNDLPAAGSNVRGVTFNPVTGNVLFASTTGGTNGGNNHFTTLNGSNGAIGCACHPHELSHRRLRPFVCRSVSCKRFLDFAQ